MGFVASFVFFLLLIGTSPEAQAFGEANRYLVYSPSSITRKALGGVRNDFISVFSADLTSFQLRVARMLGAKVEKVNKLYISSVNWGVEFMQNTPNITSTSGGRGVTIAVLDTGSTVHSDLNRVISDCRDFTQTKALVAKSCNDGNGHGTHVAGILVADGGENGNGMFGIAPNAKLVVYKVCNDNGMCFEDDIAAAIRMAADAGANLINMSFGGEKTTPLIADALKYASSKGVLVVAAAGNNGPFDDSVEYPAAYPNVIAVGALTEKGKIAQWSSRGMQVILFAPGENIQSTWKDGGYETLSGTSMAAPFVTGLAAKFWSALLSQTSDGETQFTSTSIAPLVRESLTDYLRQP